MYAWAPVGDDACGHDRVLASMPAFRETRMCASLLARSKPFSAWILKGQAQHCGIALTCRQVGKRTRGQAGA